MNKITINLKEFPSGWGADISGSKHTLTGPKRTDIFSVQGIFPTPEEALQASVNKVSEIKNIMDRLGKSL